MARDDKKTREQRKEETRQALIQAGIEAFTEQGLDLPSLDAICARAGYTRGAFYVHFPDRTEFLLAVVGRSLADFIDSVIHTDAEGGDLSKTIELFADAALHGKLPLTRRQAPRMRMLLDARNRDARIGKRFSDLLESAIIRLTKVVEKGQSGGTIRNDLNAEHLSTILVTLALGTTTMIESELKLDIPALQQTVNDLFMIKK